MEPFQRKAGPGHKQLHLDKKEASKIKITHNLIKSCRISIADIIENL